MWRLFLDAAELCSERTDGGRIYWVSGACPCDLMIARKREERRERA